LKTSPSATGRRDIFFGEATPGGNGGSRIFNRGHPDDAKERPISSSRGPTGKRRGSATTRDALRRRACEKVGILFGRTCDHEIFASPGGAKAEGDQPPNWAWPVTPPGHSGGAHVFLEKPSTTLQGEWAGRGRPQTMIQLAYPSTQSGRTAYVPAIVGLSGRRTKRI